jgi:hypothetical protein
MAAQSRVQLGTPVSCGTVAVLSCTQPPAGDQFPLGRLRSGGRLGSMARKASRFGGPAHDGLAAGQLSQPVKERSSVYEGH